MLRHRDVRSPTGHARPRSDFQLTSFCTVGRSNIRSRRPPGARFPERESVRQADSESAQHRASLFPDFGEVTSVIE